MGASHRPPQPDPTFPLDNTECLTCGMRAWERSEDPRQGRPLSNHHGSQDLQILTLDLPESLIWGSSLPQPQNFRINVPAAYVPCFVYRICRLLCPDPFPHFINEGSLCLKYAVSSVTVLRKCQRRADI